jgi:hypothetical protein
MTKKVLELFAAKIKNDITYQDDQKLVADVVIEIAKKVNHRFNENRFLKACGLTLEVE